MEVIFELFSTFIRILVIEILFGAVFYWIGWSVCKAVTFGRYPNSLKSLSAKNKETPVFIVGLAVCLAVFLSFIYWG